MTLKIMMMKEQVLHLVHLPHLHCSSDLLPLCHPSRRHPAPPCSLQDCCPSYPLGQPPASRVHQPSAQWHQPSAPQSHQGFPRCQQPLVHLHQPSSPPCQSSPPCLFL